MSAGRHTGQTLRPAVPPAPAPADPKLWPVPRPHWWAVWAAGGLYLAMAVLLGALSLARSPHAPSMIRYAVLCPTAEQGADGVHDC